MMLASSIIVREKFTTDSQNKQVFFDLKHDLSNFKLTDRLYLKSWKQIHMLRETAKKVSAKVLRKKHIPTPPNFNSYLWHRETLLAEKAIKKGNETIPDRAWVFSELGANHLMGMHEKIKEGNYAVPTSCILPLIALNQYIWGEQRNKLNEHNVKQAAKIASELAISCDDYKSFWARDQLPDAIVALEKFLQMTRGMQGIDRETSIVKYRLTFGSLELDKLRGKEAYDALLKIGGDEGVEKCRKSIISIQNPNIKKEAMKKCQEYWDMYWFSSTPPCELFPPEFMATLKKMEILKN
jgi:hypothetical protein